MRKEVAFLLVLTLPVFMAIVSAVAITDDLHVTIQVTNSSGSVSTGTYAFIFNVSNSSNCTDTSSVIYTNSSNITTDTRGIINTYLPNVTLNYDIQYWLCYYRNSTLQDAVKIARVPYVFDAKNISAQGIKNDSSIDLTGYNITGANFLGIANQSDTLDGFNSTFFFPLNTSVTGTFNFNGGWQSNGVTLDGGDLYAQTLFVYNITSLNVNNLNINGSLIPQFSLDNNFDLGNSTFRWNDLFLGGNALINGTTATANLSVTSKVLTNLVPFDNTKDLGSSTIRWRTLYVDVVDANNISAGAADIGGTTFDTFTLHTNNTGADTENITLAFERGTLSPNAAILWDSVSKRFAFNFPIYIEAGNNLSVNTGTLFADGGVDKVGVNTSTPQNTLNVVGDANVTGTVYSAVGNLSVGHQYATNGSAISWATAYNGTLAKTDAANLFKGFNQTFNVDTFFIDATNNRTGVGTATPQNKFNVVGTANVTGNLTVDNDTFFINSLSNLIGINTTSPTSTLFVLGSLNVTGNVSIGGNLTFEGSADYAEMFESIADLEKGDVVCLDSQKRISKCQTHGDKSVVGAVSSNPSIVGRSLGFKKAYPVALVGVAPVKVIGPVERFDLLTSSSVKGYAEKATINDFGAIMGKSMESCHEKECIVDVLVGLK